MKQVALCSKNTENGFTLTELLVTMAIVSVLAGVTIGVLNSDNLRQGARDKKRMSDLAVYQTALELYFADNLRYPQRDDAWTPLATLTELQPYIRNLPEDPLALGVNPCNSSDDYGYYYISKDSGSVYVLTTLMELEKTNEGKECNNIDIWDSTWCPDPLPTQNWCYGLRSPSGGSGTSTLANIQVTFDDWVVCYEPNDWGWSEQVSVSFNVPAGYQNFATFSGIVYEGHPTPPEPYGCLPGGNNDPPTADPHCDQADPLEAVEFYLNGNLCYAHPDQNPEDDWGFNFGPIICNGIGTGTNTLTAIGTGVPEPWQLSGGVLVNAPVGSVDFTTTLTVRPN